jgi:hypothetical protein
MCNIYFTTEFIFILVLFYVYLILLFTNKPTPYAKKKKPLNIT